jgi:hypothetical protein
MSGYKSKEFGGWGYNQLVFDACAAVNRVVSGNPPAYFPAGIDA